MIIVQLSGGLGNQMFEYSFGKRLALLNNTKLKIDISKLKNNNTEGITKREYRLFYLNIENFLASNKEIEKFNVSNNIIKDYINWVFKKLGFIFILNENKFQFYNTSLVKCKNIYVKGYWQSFKYFNPISDVIKNEFKVKPEYLKNFKELFSEIVDRNSVAIHVRRGDYSNNPSTNLFHGLISNEFYFKAIDYMYNKTINPYFYIFSDDTNWVKNNLKFNLKFNSKFKVIEGNPDYIDMNLISKCKHQIIANSSFSWWGAWLNENPDKIVIAPKNWFTDTSINTSDLIPQNWVIM